MPRLEGRSSSREMYPAADLQIESFVDPSFHYQGIWKNRPCIVKEHTGPTVYFPDDNAVLIQMAQEGKLNVCSMVTLKDQPLREIGGYWGGFACPDCTQLIENTELETYASTSTPPE